MRKIITIGYLLSAALGFALLGLGLSGCALHTPAPGTSGQTNWVNTVELLSREAAWTATSIHLEDHPEDRPRFVAAVAALSVLDSPAGEISVMDFHAALAGLPELRGSRAAIVLGSGVAIYSAVCGWIDVDQAPLVAAAVRGTRFGMEQALRQGPAQSGHLDRGRLSVPQRQ